MKKLLLSLISFWLALSLQGPPKRVAMAQPAFLHLHGHPDVAFWNARDGLRVKSLARIAVSSRGTLLVVDDDNGLVFHDTMTWKHTVWPEGEAVPSMRQSIACSADGSLIALGTIAGELVVYAYPSGRIVLREPLLQGTDLQMAMTVFRHLGESPFGIQQLEFDGCSPAGARVYAAFGVAERCESTGVGAARLDIELNMVR